MSISRVLFMSLLLAVAATGCDDDDDNPVGNPGPDETAPSVLNVDAIDANHIEVLFNEDVETAGAENVGNYTIIQTGAGGDPVDTLTVNAAVLHPGGRTLSLTTSAMNSAPYRLEVSGVQDLAGNEMQTTVVKTFSGTDDPDNTRPELLSSEPAADARDVAIDAPIDLVFSEPILLSSLIAGTTWSSNLGDVEFTANTEDSLHVSLVPNSALAPDTRYTLDFDDVQDLSGNTMTSETLIFTTVER